MNESAGESGTPGNDDVNARPLDGSLDFSTYSRAQLLDLRQIIDPQLQPLNFANLLAEIARRSAAEEPGLDGAVQGSHSRRGGLWGWLAAKRHRSPLYGEGTIRVDERFVELDGFQRTWLGLPMPASLQYPLERIRNVAVDDELIEFEITRRFWFARRVRFRARNADAAVALKNRLPARQSSGFEQRWRELHEYRARIDGLGGLPWSVYALVAANIAVFTIMAIRHGVAHTFDVPTLIDWGANYGPATLDGQPLRLVTAQFVHGNLLHLLSNLWVLFNVGRLARELYGNATFLGIYFGAGVCSYLTSLAWDPSVVAVGASGPIFGILAAFLAFLVRHRAQLPTAVMRAHWLSTLVFLVFNIVSGFAQTGIDNAAHVGGALSGFALGWVLARPLDAVARTPWPVWRAAAAVLFVSGAGALSLWQVRGLTTEVNPLTKFLKDNDWYVRVEQKNLADWQEIVGQLGAGAMSTAEGARRFRKDILPFWDEAAPKLSAYSDTGAGKGDEFARVMWEFASLRQRWAETISMALENTNRDRHAELNEIAAETDDIQAQIGRLQLRSSMELRPRALKHSLLVNRMRRLANPWGWKCVDHPVIVGRKLGKEDSPADSPALSNEVGCRAQRLFEDGDFVQLDALLHEKAAHLNDLPDGASSLGAILNALRTQIFYGSYQLDALMGRTADWRRAVKDPVMAELVEVLIFQQWAWSARGQAGANEVSAQQWYHFRHRSQMAVAGLRAIETTGQDNPVWHDLSIDVALDMSEDASTIRAIFDRGVQRFPTYYPIYDGMLRVLMPRWLGSHSEIDRFIESVSNRGQAGPDTELYARLYWSYFLMEMDTTNIFQDGNAGWNNLDIGFSDLEKRHPDSDYLLNAHAVMACVAGDPTTYSRLRLQIGQRMSGSAWSDRWSLAKCDSLLHPSR